MLILRCSAEVKRVEVSRVRRGSLAVGAVSVDGRHRGVPRAARTAKEQMRGTLNVDRRGRRVRLTVAGDERLVVAATRALLSGHVFGAVAVARNQLERLLMRRTRAVDLRFTAVGRRRSVRERCVHSHRPGSGYARFVRLHCTTDRTTHRAVGMPALQAIQARRPRGSDDQFFNFPATLARRPDR